MSRRSAKHITSLLAAVVTLTLGYYLNAHPTTYQKLTPTLPSGSYRVTEFVDGDTIKVAMNGKQETLRFIGVDTPETHDPRKVVQCFGMAAAAYTKNLIGNNPVRLEADPLSTNRDRYDRLLRYIYLPDGRLVQAELLKNGYAFAYLGFPFSKSDEFAGYQKQAREQNKGLWSSCDPQVNQYGGFTSNPAQ